MRSLLPLFLASALFAKELTVDLRHPVYKEGALTTTEGGVIRGKELRIQAKSIRYTKQLIEAEGDLLVQYKGRAFIGKNIRFDLAKNEGIIYEGKTFFSLWYMAGEEIELHSDGSYHMRKGTITTSENRESSWDLYAEKIDALKGDYFSGKNICFRLFSAPVFWVPSVKWHFSQNPQNPLLRYTLNWDKGQGPRAAMRYQLYSWREFALFGRVEYRWATGWGGAIETEYFPPDGGMTFVTRSYLGTDRLQTAPNKEFRHRLEGEGRWESRDAKTRGALTWDQYNDVRMPNDFPSDDFEINTAGQTLFWLHHQEPFGIAALKVRPRVNSFESIKQDLPTLYMQLHPQPIGPTGILNFSHLKAAYLDFAYSNQLAASPPLFPPADYRSGRLEWQQRFYRPIQLGPCTLTPNIGGSAILYTNSPSHKIKPFAFGLYGLSLSMEGKKSFSKIFHRIQPYASFSAITRPTTAPDAHYIFSIQDGTNKINQIQAGVRNLLFSTERPGRGSLLSADLYANAFFSDEAIPQFIPRLYLWMSSELPSCDLALRSCWNFRNHLLDYTNALCRWTVNKDIALTLEARYRSCFDWRKADHENFILDVTRSQSALLSSPLSDRRIALLANLFIRLNPFWELSIASHHGFYRLTEAPYNEVEIDLTTWISSALKLRLSYSHTDLDDRFSADISLIKK